MTLPEGVTADKIKATFKNGVVEVTMPAAKGYGSQENSIRDGAGEFRKEVGGTMAARPISHPVLCHAHARMKLARGRAAGLKVYDERCDWVSPR
jgi:Hsp20/alpha crystallin family